MADNEDYDDLTIEEQFDEFEVHDLDRKGHYRSAVQSLPDLMIRLALTPAQIKKLKRDRTTCMIIEAPSAEWVEPLAKSAKLLGDWQFVHSTKEPVRKSHGSDTSNDQAVHALATGGRTLGVSQNPFSYLPKAMTSSADIVLKIAAPDDEILREAIKLATGRTPRSMPQGISASLDYGEICGAIRVGSTAKSCVDRLLAAARAKTMVDPKLADVPLLESLHGYGEALEWGKAVVADLQAWRAGQLDFSAIDRAVVLVSPPGLGKTTFAKSLAKSAGIPLIATSVSGWFANSPGYLDSVIKQIDQVFADAAAVAPAAILFDELDGLPSRIGLDSDRGSWWTPVVGHMLLKLDSAISSDSSQLILIGATNHPEKCDPAILRQGRFGRVVHIQHPTADDLQGIMRQHLGSDLPGEDLSLIAKIGVGGSGADVTGWVKAARRVARLQDRAMTLEDMFDQVAPPETRPPDMLRRIAVHEASHAVVSHMLREGSVTGITLIGRDASEGGHTSMTFNVDDVMARSDIETAAAICLAGRCGEEVCIGSVSSGAGGSHQSDLARATFFLAQVHTSLGLADKLLHRATPDNVMQLVTLDPELAKTVEADLQRVYAAARKIVEGNVTLIEAVTAALLKHRHLTGDQFLAICNQSSRKPIKVKGGHHG